MEQQGYMNLNNINNYDNGNFGNNRLYNAALYMRFSKDDGQSGENSSIESQRILLTRYCNDNGYKIFSEYVDDGYSGLNYDRPEFQRMLKDITDG